MKLLLWMFIGLSIVDATIIFKRSNTKYYPPEEKYNNGRNTASIFDSSFRGTNTKNISSIVDMYFYEGISYGNKVATIYASNFGMYTGIQTLDSGYTQLRANAQVGSSCNNSFIYIMDITHNKILSRYLIEDSLKPHNVTLTSAYETNTSVYNLIVSMGANCVVFANNMYFTVTLT